ncbi:MAG: response regulator [Lachnospiraceae bacterium]|nr:response regulator [Lachnospiraceae bacterium]MBQ8549030.1 response regulator [Lachnospiraceae bacterium]
MAITVLVVDDSKTSRKMLTDVLTRMGLEVIGEAVNGEEGFLKYKELRPDIVTMDITMPVMNGLESLLLIKHEDENAKVVMITAAGQKNNLMQAVKAGAEEFLTKPLEEEEIRRVIGEISAKLEK